MELRVKTVEYFRSIESAQDEVEAMQARASKMNGHQGENGQEDVPMEVGRNGAVNGHPR